MGNGLPYYLLKGPGVEPTGTKRELAAILARSCESP